MTKNVNSKNHRRAGSSPDHWQSSEAAAHRLSGKYCLLVLIESILINFSLIFRQSP